MTEDIFQRIIAVLDKASIPYMLTGSMASSWYGTPRTTQDIDMVIAPTLDQVRELVRLLPENEYYVDETTALDAVVHKGMFNVVDFKTGWKVDFIIRKNRPFSVEEFDRRKSTQFLGLNVAIASAEDVVIAKLEWAKAAGSQRQLEDVISILRTRKEHLDVAYIRHWATELNLQELWNSCASAAETGK